MHILEAGTNNSSNILCKHGFKKCNAMENNTITRGVSINRQPNSRCLTYYDKNPTYAYISNLVLSWTKGLSYSSH